MSTLLYVVVFLVAAGLLFLLLRRPVSEYIRMRGTRVVACPENELPAAGASAPDCIRIEPEERPP